MRFFLVLCVLLFVFTGCNNKYENLLKSNIAEVREYILIGESENIKVNFVGGKRESDYVMNGYATEIKEFGVLTFELDNIDDYDVSLAKYVLFVGSVRYDGELLQNPFDKSLVVDICKNIDYNQNIVAKIMIGDYCKEIKLNLINDNFKVDYNRAINIFCDNYKENLKALNIDGGFKGELYVKIVDDADEHISDFYWYVCMVTREMTSFSCIISPYTGEILATSNNFDLRA